MAILFINFLGERYFSDIFEEAEKKLIENQIICVPLSWRIHLRSREGIETDQLITLDRLKTALPKEALLPERKIIWSNFDQAKNFFLASIDRVFLRPRTAKYYDDYFRFLIIYFFYHIKKKSLRLFVYESTPHMPWDIVSFYVAKYHSIPTIILRRTIFENISFISNDFRSGLTHIYESESMLGVPFNALNSKDSLIIKRSNEINLRSLTRIEPSFRLVINLFLSLIISLLKGRSSDYSLITRRERFFYTLQRGIGRIRALRTYNSLCTNFDMEKKFVYFALHFRPERSTVPEGGYYSNQIEAIKELRSALSEDIILYVKEHPRQFDDVYPDLRRLRQSEWILYQEIARLENVRLVSLGVSSELLLNGCLMTASITGSVVWQGLELGKPGCTFGNVWHSECDSSPDLSISHNVKDEVARLLKKERKDVEFDLSQFMYGFQRKAFRGSANYLNATSIPSDYRCLVSSAANELTYRSMSELNSASSDL